MSRAESDLHVLLQNLQVPAGSAFSCRCECCILGTCGPRPQLFLYITDEELQNATSLTAFLPPSPVLKL